MLIHSWDAALDDEEWRRWQAGGHDFGELAINHRGNLPSEVVPTHFALDGDQLLVHLARTNPVWSAIETQPNVLMSVVDDYAFIPSTWRAHAGGPDENDAPTSYYTAVQLACDAEVVDEPRDIAELLSRQLAHFHDQNPEAHREAVSDRLELRGGARDAGAAAQQRRRLQRIGDWPGWSGQ